MTVKKMVKPSVLLRTAPDISLDIIATFRPAKPALDGYKG